MLSTQVSLSAEMPTVAGLASLSGGVFCPDLVWAFRLSRDSTSATVSNILIRTYGFIWLKILTEQDKENRVVVRFWRRKSWRNGKSRPEIEQLRPKDPADNADFRKGLRRIG